MIFIAFNFECSCSWLTMKLYPRLCKYLPDFNVDCSNQWHTALRAQVSISKVLRSHIQSDLVDRTKNGRWTSDTDAVQVVKKVRMLHIRFVYPKMGRRSTEKYSRSCEKRVVIIMTTGV